MSSMTLRQVRDRLHSYAKDADLYASKTGKSLELTTADELADAIHAHLLSLDDELADYKNASLHAADDCTAKDAEIARLQSRLASADALLREVYDHGENMALHEKIAAHLSENTHDRA